MDQTHVARERETYRLDYRCCESSCGGVSEETVAAARSLKLLNFVNDRLVVESKGIYSIEKCLVARRLMYWQVYLHKTSVAAEQMLIKILTRAKELVAKGEDIFASPALRYFLYNHITKSDFIAHSEVLENYALLADSDIWSAMKVWSKHSDKIFSMLCAAILNLHLLMTKILSKPIN